MSSLVEYTQTYRYEILTLVGLNILVVASAFMSPPDRYEGRESSVGRASGYGLDDRYGQECSLLHVQTGYGVHPVSCPMGTGGSFPMGKAVGAWSWPLTSNVFMA
jgi:hypothetical protein